MQYIFNTTSRGSGPSRAQAQAQQGLGWASKSLNPGSRKPSPSRGFQAELGPHITTFEVMSTNMDRNVWKSFEDILSWLTVNIKFYA